MKQLLTTKIKEEIEDRIGKKRMAHALRVADYAKDMAIQYGVDPDKAYLAGAFHDCMKIRDHQALIQAAKELNLPWRKDFDQAPQLIHSFLGAHVAKHRYGIKDQEILDAIAYHTTGRANMTKLDKIIYLADYAEPMRNFPGVDKARDLIKKDLDQAMFFALNHTLTYLIEKNAYITPLSIEARNTLLKEESHGEIL